MKKNLLRFFFLFLSLISINNPKACDVLLQNTEIVNSEFYVNFTQAVEKIFLAKGYSISDSPDAPLVLTTKNYITTGTNYFRLKQANIQFELKTQHSSILIHELSNCLTMSCPASNYIKVLKKVLKKLDQKLVNCRD